VKPYRYGKPEKIGTEEARRVASNAEVLKDAPQLVQRAVTSGLIRFPTRLAPVVAKPAIDWCVKCGKYHKTEKVCK
jgi:hypothetical protein